MITFLEAARQFQINTAHTTYAFAVTDEGYLTHLYWGAKLEPQDLTAQLRLNEPPFVPSQNNRDRACFLDSAPFEYPCAFTGDYREHAFGIETTAGYRACDLRYVRFRIFSDKQNPQGLPHTFGDGCETLQITLQDELTGVTVLLNYSVFRDSDAIIRRVAVRNDGQKPVLLNRVLSASVDMDDDRFEMISLYGSWARERQLDRKPLRHGKQRIDSLRGASSHQYSPFFALVRPETTEQTGEAYGFTLLYSGNFMLQAELTQHCQTRAQIGIQPEDFVWELQPGAFFDAPEAVLMYSKDGIGGMSRGFHHLFRYHLIRGKWRDQARPVLLNNWEATYFDFDLARLQGIAQEAARLGIELFVLDDGWFGKRDSDNSSLGDWTPDQRKLPGGLKPLADTVTGLGMKFGLWIEPEMVSPDSDLFRAHPDWAIQIPNRPMTQAREQYVLDFSREEVRAAVWKQLAAILAAVPVSYIKWDMNRQITEPASAVLPPYRQKELWHRYQLGVYAFMERLVTEYPDILLETCAGGGGRFDAGMLYYSPQIWCSDNTDACDRLRIQYGASLFMPPSAIGAHVSVCPNHANGRFTPMDTRANVAMNGTFGYELDVTRLTDADKAQIPQQIQRWHQVSGLVRDGAQYRLGNPFAAGGCAAQSQTGWDAWLYVSQDQSQALLTYVQITAEANLRSRRIRLAGLNETALYRYQLGDTEEVRTGAYLMQCGILIRSLGGDMQSVQILLSCAQAVPAQ